MTKFKEILNDLSTELSKVDYENGDLSDIGNEIGIVIGKYINKKDMGYELGSFVSGVKHGVSLTDGTH
jgi:hypothetical protein